MPEVPTKIITPTGTVTLDAHGLNKLPANTVVRIVVDAGSVPAGGQVNALDISADKPVVIAWDKTVPFEMVWTTPAVGNGVLEIEVRTRGQTVALAKFAFLATVATPDKPSTPPVVTTPPVGNHPDSIDVPVKGKPSTVLAACFDDGIDKIPFVQAGYKLGITEFRCFGSGADDKGGFSGGCVKPIQMFLDQVPGATFTVLFGRQETNDELGRTAKPLKPDQQRAYWQAVAEGTKGWDRKRVWFELQNEYNADHYLRFGTGTNEITQERIDYIMREAQYARDALGPNVLICGPSIGYLDNNAAGHVAWCKAMVKAGILKLIDRWNTHIYFWSADQIKLLIDGTRAVIGDVPWCSTETNLRQMQIGHWKTDAAPRIKQLRDAGIILFAYRLYPNPKSAGSMDDRGVLDKAGKLLTVSGPVWLGKAGT